MAYTFEEGKEIHKKLDNYVNEAVLKGKGFGYLEEGLVDILSLVLKSGKIENKEVAIGHIIKIIGPKEYNGILQGFSLIKKEGLATQGLKAIIKGLESFEDATVHEYISYIEPKEKNLTREEKINRNLQKIIEEIAKEHQEKGTQ